MKRVLSLFACCILFILSGCLYPEERRVENMGSLDVHIQTVQDAVNRYQKDTGVLPIKNSTLDTPIYEKYVIDMGRIYPGYLGYIPGNAFENGGVHQYVLITPEEKPTVKLMDLVTVSRVNTVQAAVNEYEYKKGKLPIKEKINSQAYEIDYKALKVMKPEIISPFTGQALEIFLTPKGEVMIDYAIDIGIFMNKGYTFTGNDAREVLVQNSFFVPAKSLPYVWENGEAKLAK
jgi:hypothetical protein